MKTVKLPIVALFVLLTLPLHAQRMNNAYTFSTGVDSTLWIDIDSLADTLVGDTTVTLSGLYDTTTYSGTLQSVCPSGTSNPVAFSFTTAISPAHAPLFSCNFEADDAMDVWEQRWVTSDGGTWLRVSDNTRPVGNRWTARCQSGSLNPTNTWLITPNITLPADADGYFLRWKQRVVDNMGFNPTFEVRLAAATDTIADGAPTSAYSTILFTSTNLKTNTGTSS